MDDPRPFLVIVAPLRLTLWVLAGATVVIVVLLGIVVARRLEGARADRRREHARGELGPVFSRFLETEDPVRLADELRPAFLRMDAAERPVAACSWSTSCAERSRRLSGTTSGMPSRSEPRLRVVHKDNGGRSDAINAGISIARGELVVIVDADSLLEPQAITCAVRPFEVHPHTCMAVGGGIGVANGSRIVGGRVVTPAVSSRASERHRCSSTCADSSPRESRGLR
jgi:hypothetical protein